MNVLVNDKFSNKQIKLFLNHQNWPKMRQTLQKKIKLLEMMHFAEHRVNESIKMFTGQEKKENPAVERPIEQPHIDICK